MSSSVVVRVPASTSNLGAGFDCIGVAVDRWLTVAAFIEPGIDEPIRLSRGGTLRSIDASPDHDRIAIAFRKACAAAGREVPRGVLLRADSDIPIARGLGSSAAATVAGAASANILLELGFDDPGLLGLCAAIEGHPDNVVPAIHGGAMLAVGTTPSQRRDTELPVWISAPIELHPELALALVVPDFEIETAFMRAAIPATVPHSVAARAAALAAALVSGMITGNPKLLELALDDVLHVPFRRDAVPGYDSVVAAARSAGAYGATLSGSGSTVCAVAPRRAVHDAAAAMVDAWSALDVRTEVIVAETPVSGYSASLHQYCEDVPDAGGSDRTAEQDPETRTP